jgi:hypothetical protein
MKKMLLSVAVIATIGFTSCGGPSVCDCMNETIVSDACAAAGLERMEEYATATDDQKQKWMDEQLACTAGH